MESGLLLACVMALAACASSPRLADSTKLALYQANAGEPVASFRLFGALSSWTPLGDGALAVWTRPNEAWLLELSGPCMELEFAPAIRVTDSLGRVSARFDRVIPLEMGGGPRTMQVPCIIQTIRPLDAAAIRAGERELRDAPANAPDQPSGT
ncbi:MAG: DUF6491 family protein [Pseudoxanthomonas suwonensis]|nr:DUF6491 family protein [Pseudoxanthomonas suwonensis]